MLDAGHALGSRTAMRRADLLEPCKRFWIEEPLHPEDIRGYGRLPQSMSQPLAAGEGASSVAQVERLIDEGGVDIVQMT